MGQITNTKVQHARDTFCYTYEKLLVDPGLAQPEFLRDLRSRRVIYRALKECGLPRELEREVTILVQTLYNELDRAPSTSNRELRRFIGRVADRLRRERVAMNEPHFALGAPEWRALTDDTIGCLERYALLPPTPRGPKISPITTAVWMLVGMALKHSPDIDSRALTTLAMEILEPAVNAASGGPDGDCVDWREQIVRALREHRRT